MQSEVERRNTFRELVRYFVRVRGCETVVADQHNKQVIVQVVKVSVNGEIIQISNTYVFDYL